MRLLALVRERTEPTHEPVFVAQFAAACKLSISEAEAAWRYLRDLGLIRLQESPERASADRSEQLMISPIFPSLLFVDRIPAAVEP
jgi:hypothetical protein